MSDMSLILANRESHQTEAAPVKVDLNRNVQALIENPLHEFTPEGLMTDIEDFVRSKKLDDLELFKRAAKIARDPRYFDRAINDENEKDALKDETRHRFDQPRGLWVTIMTCSVGAIVQGWVQTGTNGANLAWPKALGLLDGDGHPIDPGSYIWILGIVNAAPYLASALVGCWLSYPLNHRFGRRGAILFAAAFTLAFVLGSAFTQTWQQLFVCRLFLGLGMGVKASTIPIYAAETAPAYIRGGLVMGWQIWVAFGILLGFSANLAIFQTGDNIAWRLQIGSAFIPVIPLFIGLYFCPESPRWYIKKNRYHDAFNALCSLRNTRLQAARDLYYIHAQAQLEGDMLGSGADKSSKYITRLRELFIVPKIRRATLASFVVMLAQQMCGINIVVFYSTTLYVGADAGNASVASIETALLVSWGFGVLNFLFAWPAVRYIDPYGRRSLLLLTFPFMAITLLIAACCFLVAAPAAHLGLTTTFIFLFAAIYSPGEGPVPFTYSAEAFPLFHREVGMGFAVAVNLFWAGILTLVFPRMTDAFTATGAVAFFAFVIFHSEALNVIAFVMIFLWVPETKQRTLEELNYIFGVPTQKHMHYQTAVYLPYLYRRYVMRKDVELEPLYKFD
ncbi:hypothetical protein MMC34_007417 [Xylographa carneopallida]|nr:hypothetical protein [Xylographa carneopallida]